MRVVLRSDVAHLGKRGDIREVADGYARNYLLPKGHAIVAGTGLEAQATAMRRARDRRDARDREAAEALARLLVPEVIRIPARAGAEGKLFGSVTVGRLSRRWPSRPGSSWTGAACTWTEAIRSLGVPPGAGQVAR